MIHVVGLAFFDFSVTIMSDMGEDRNMIRAVLWHPSTSEG